MEVDKGLMNSPRGFGRSKKRALARFFFFLGGAHVIESTPTKIQHELLN